MFKDLKKFLEVNKTIKWREKIQTIPVYFDGLERLHNRIHPGKQFLRVTDIYDLSKDTKLYRFVSANPNKLLAPFRAGQYLGLTVEIDGVRTNRPYSLVSSPNQLAYYELGIKKKQNGFVSPYIIENVKMGDNLEVTEPMGDLYYNRLFHGKNLVFIAGGCGITPFISILREITEKEIPINIWLLFGCLTQGDVLFKKELEDMQERRSNIKVEFILSQPDSTWKGFCGFISKEIISKFLGTVNDKFFYIVGNEAMYRFILNELETLKVSRHKIIHEAFGVPDDITQSMGWPKNIDASKKVTVTVEYNRNGEIIKEQLTAPCVEPLLNSLERSGIVEKINTGCRSGECALCRTRLTSGKVFIPKDVITREFDDKFGFIHPCISYPIEDLCLDLSQ